MLAWLSWFAASLLGGFFGKFATSYDGFFDVSWYTGAYGDDSGCVAKVIKAGDLYSSILSACYFGGNAGEATNGGANAKDYKLRGGSTYARLASCFIESYYASR